jgi:hypothetical protein
MSTITNEEQIDIARGLMHMALGVRRAKGGATTLVQQAEDVARASNEPVDKIVAYLLKVIPSSNHTIDSLANCGFSLEVLNAVEAVTRTPDESYVQCMIRARKNIIGKRVMFQYLQHDIHAVKGERLILKYAKALVTLLG